jgi:hypothetical protein
MNVMLFFFSSSFFLKDITTLILLRELIVLGTFWAKVVLELFIQVFVFMMECW